MTKQADPFERAVAKEAVLRERAAAFESTGGMLSLIMRWFAALGAAWALIVVLHWVVFPEPRWLAVLHTIVFVLTVGYWCAAVLFVRTMRRRRPDFFEDA